MKQSIKQVSRRTLAIVLSVMTLFSTMLLGTITTANATSGKFTNGSTIYFNSSSVSSWASDDAIVGAIFYYQDNDDWCYETGNGNYSDSNIGNKTAFENSSKYETATKVANNIYSVTVPSSNLGSVRFIRIQKSSGTAIWNYSARMSVDNMGSNNCVSISGWDNTGSWSTYAPPTPVSYKLMKNDHSSAGTEVGTFTSVDGVLTATYNIATAGTYYFYVSDGSKGYFNADKTFSDNTGVQVYQYGSPNCSIQLP